MNLIELSKLLLDEQAAEQYLLEKGILKTFTECAKCGSTKIGRIRRGRCRCYSCRFEWSARKGSITYYSNLSYSKFLGIIKMFELNIDSIVAAKQLGLNKNTTNNIYTLLRRAISNYSESLESENNKKLQKSIPAFGITVIKGKVNISSMDKSKLPESLFTLIRTRDPNNNITFYFDYKRIKRLIHNDQLEKFSFEADHFFRHLRESLLKYRGTKLSFLYLYLKEIEFRYNNRNLDNLFECIIAKMADFEGWSDSH